MDRASRTCGTLSRILDIYNGSPKRNQRERGGKNF